MGVQSGDQINVDMKQPFQEGTKGMLQDAQVGLAVLPPPAPTGGYSGVSYSGSLLGSATNAYWGGSIPNHMPSMPEDWEAIGGGHATTPAGYGISPDLNGLEGLDVVGKLDSLLAETLRMRGESASELY